MIEIKDYYYQRALSYNQSYNEFGQGKIVFKEIESSNTKLVEDIKLI